MIGQSQVTDPLMTALRSDRVGHAYLFSGPRGCGKTTSARILARCLNCAEGPTDTPCGKCESCVELSREGGGSLDVVEIDAASHGGVDDARDLRERAVFAPARDRYKIFIIDEAHMVTSGGFNALLKLVEEPPPHVKFIFATTEPEKVLGTIRSRTHHYPFRLVPPAAMLEYLEAMCEVEGVEVEAGVLPLVVRAGGGSPRDTLSILDQLIAGSEAVDGSLTVPYERAVALLGYTPASLLDGIVDALAAGDAAASFPAVDRVVQTGQDPRRFVDDLLERLRDLIVIAAVGDDAGKVLHGRSAEEISRMQDQAQTFGAGRLSRAADIVIAALDEMAGATSPRLQLELMVARVLAATSPSTATGHAPESVQDAGTSPAPKSVPDAGTNPAPAREATAATRSVTPPAGPITFAEIQAAWPAILGRLEQLSRASWLAVTVTQPLDYDTEQSLLKIGFTSEAALTTFKGKKPGSGPSDHLREAILAELGVRVKYVPAAIPAPEQPATETVSTKAQPAKKPPASHAANATIAEWAVAPIPNADVDNPPAAVTQLAVDEEPADSIATPVAAPVDGEFDEGEPPLPGDEEEPISAPSARASAPLSSNERYGEAVVREVLGATFLREEPYEPPTKFS
jgi:DNA polymerase-3 subunit gamma/tau